LQSIELGPFKLKRRIGSGGMGEVWLAEHINNNERIAIKTIHLGADEDGLSGNRFFAEVQAVARLAHRNIVAIHDFGVVPAVAAEQSMGILHAGSPWFAMEYCEGGDLADAEVADWPSLRRIFEDLLEALALTHANGVLHRDLKPANVLVTQNDQGETIYKLADFGLAWSTEASANLTLSGQSVGTPNYMAPEQATGQQYKFGPSTDLYAFGCLAWRLACGDAPFVEYSTEPVELLKAQVSAYPPQFRPLIALPRGVEMWIRKLLQKDTSERFQFAADALRSLPSLSAACDQPAMPRVSATSDDGPTKETATVRSPSVEGLNSALPLRLLKTKLHPVGRRHRALPADWRQRSLNNSPNAGLGMGLIGLREVLMVGHEELRDQLWASLGEMLVTGAPRLLYVSGQAGVGKTRLMHWLARSAHRRGLASYAIADCRGQMEDGTSLAEALAGRLGIAAGMQPQAALLAVATYLSRYRLDGVEQRQALLAAFDSVVPFYGSSALVDGEGRMRSLIGLVQQLSRVHPMVLVLDDGATDAYALEFAERLLELGDCPCLILLAHRPLLESGEQRFQGVLSRLAEQSGASEHVLEPLGPADFARYLDSLIALDGESRDRIISAANGVPETARQILMHAVEQDSFGSGHEGLELGSAEGEARALAPSLAQAISQRTQAAVSALSSDDRRQLQLGTLLGEPVAIDLHQALCIGRGLSYNKALIPDLARRAIVGLSRTGWGFVDSAQAAVLFEDTDISLQPEDMLKAADILDASERSESLVSRWLAARNRAAAGDPRGASQLSELLRSSLDEGRFDAAWRIAQDFFAHVPDTAPSSRDNLHYRMRLDANLSLYHQHRIDAALQDIDAFIADNPDLPLYIRQRALVRRGMMLRPGKRWELYQTILDENPEPKVEILIRPSMAQRAESKGDVEASAQHLERALVCARAIDGEQSKERQLPLLGKRVALAIARGRLDRAEQDLNACGAPSEHADLQVAWRLERRWIELLWSQGDEELAWERLRSQADSERRRVGHTHPNTLELFLLIGALRGDRLTINRIANEGLALGIKAFSEIFEAAQAISALPSQRAASLRRIAEVLNAIPGRFRLAQITFLVGRSLAACGESELAITTLRHAKERLAVYANEAWLERCDEQLRKLSIS
jgi:serine/threonine protein kinase